VAGPVVVDPAVLPVVVPFVDEPVVVPLAAGPPAAELPPAEAVPLFASANEPVSANVAANAIVASFTVASLVLLTTDRSARLQRGGTRQTACISVFTRRQSPPIERHSGWNLSQTSPCQLSQWRCIP
jgi:hypothetical protein